jgi:hypothetical protein
MIGLAAPCTFAQLGTTGNTALLLFYTLLNSPLHTHTLGFSLVVSWQRIYNNLSLQITHEVVLAPPKSFLAIILQLSSQLMLPTLHPCRLASQSPTLHSRLLSYTNLCCRTLLYNHFA